MNDSQTGFLFGLLLGLMVAMLSIIIMLSAREQERVANKNTAATSNLIHMEINQHCTVSGSLSASDIKCGYLPNE